MDEGSDFVDRSPTK